MRRIPKSILLFSGIAILIMSGAFVDDYFEISKQLDIFSNVYKTVNQLYVDDIKPGELMKTGIDGMLKNLDPYTNYYPESEIEDYKMKHVSTEYGGLGAASFKRGDSIVIAEVYEGFAAQKADLRAGDVLLEVNGRPLKGLAPDEADDLMKGQSGTTIKIKIGRPGISQPIEKTITREEIKIKNVPYYGMISDSIGYIKLDKFLQNCYSEMHDAFTELKKNPRLKSLVFDLRGNGGGLLDESVNILNLWIPKGTLLVKQVGKIQGSTNDYAAKIDAMDPAMPVTVLIDRGSASASEITAGNFQDLDRAVIIGQRSFGKGLVQQTKPLSYNTQVKITVAKYFTASGRCVQAINYATRHEDGSVDHVPDSLIKPFQTTHGRTVYDGSGVYPDRFIEPAITANITGSLAKKLLLFDYATYYRNHHDSIASARQFELTDADYNDFIKFLSDKDYDYSTDSEKNLEELKAIATKDKYFDNIKSEFEKLGQKLKHDKNADLIKFKPEIKLLLEKEIVSRYYFQKGKYEYSFYHDAVVADAITVLNDPVLYANILKGEGNYKVIGKPKHE